MADAGKFLFDTDKTVEFVRYWNELSIIPINIQKTAKSDAGLVETQEYYDNTRIKLGRDQIDGNVFNKLRAWWNYVKDGTAFSLWINRFLGLYLDFDEMELIDNDRNTGTFTRTVTSKYVHAETGLITEAAQNMPRFTVGKYGAGLLIEKLNTNFLYYPEQLDQTPGTTPPVYITDQGWNAQNLTVTADQLVAPDGNVTAEKLYATGGSGGSLYQQTCIAISGADLKYTFAVYMKVISGTLEVDISIDDSGGGVLKSETVTVTTEWQRFSVSHTTVGAGSGNFMPRICLKSQYDIVYATMAMYNSGLYLQSYNNAGMNKEMCYFALPANWNRNKWSISFWFSPMWSEAINDEDRRFLAFYYDTSSHWYFKLKSTGVLELALKYEDGSGPLIINPTSNPYGITQNAFNYFVITCDGSISNGVNVYINGAYKYTATCDPFSLREVNRLYLGSTAAPAEHVDGVFDEVVIEPNKILSQAEITTRFNSEYALGLRENYFASVKLVNAQFDSSLHQGGIKHRFGCELEEVLS